MLRGDLRDAEQHWRVVFEPGHHPADLIERSFRRTTAGERIDVLERYLAGLVAADGLELPEQWLQALARFDVALLGVSRVAEHAQRIAIAGIDVQRELGGGHCAPRIL